MSAYLVANVTWNDVDAAKRYFEIVVDSLRPFGGKYLARGPIDSVIEGDAVPARLAVLEFPSLDAAKSWIASQEYRPALEIRQKSAKTHWIVLIEGISR
jgi:uncharacterized protein (DUF1330 family)